MAMHTPGPTITPPTGQLVRGHLLKQRYRILDSVGQGGFAAVYKAADTLFGHRLVAVKEMSHSNLNPQELVAATVAFQREAHMLVDLSHPNLPRIYDQFAEDRRWYLVMDFIAGQTLEELLNITNRHLPLERAIQIGIELCTVLDYLHARQPPIIFRDLKPSNIMLTPDEHLYLIDFGIARHFKPGQTKDTTAFGTPGYAAPEQFGKSQTTPRADIYSLGATLHHLITGYDPSLTPFRFASLHSIGQPIPAGLEPLIMQMVEIDESKRPDSMVTVKQELQRIVALNAAKKMKPSLPLVGGTQLGLTLYIYRGHTARVNAIAWSPDGTYIASASEDKTVQVWNILTGDQIFTYCGHSDAVNSVTWSPDGTRIASASSDSTVQVWDATTGQNVLTYTGHTNRVLTIAWSPDGPSSSPGRGPRIASGGDDKTLQVWNAITGKHICTYRCPDWLRAVVWSPDGTYIASGGDDDTVRVKDATAKFRSSAYREHTHWVRALAWSPNGLRIASGSEDKTVQVWNANTKSTILTYNQHANGVRAVVWSPDGKYIASGSGSNDSYSADNTVRVWDSTSGDTLYAYRGHQGPVLALAWTAKSPSSFSGLGSRIASASKDGTVQIWQAM
jgi:serine/threonine protein kinase